ncbi:hypothetical protein [Streptomyces sp. NPDC052302]|uniref:hypothetical protein n=1 Tax=Streptomyces sp. NPDC052302 TaxID=3365688 RepID=UPI0037D0FAE8
MGQWRPMGAEWITAAEGDWTTEPQDVAGCLWFQLERAGFQDGEIPARVAELARGVVLIGGNGTAFRVITNPAHRA